MWQQLLMQGLGMAANAAQGGPSSAANKSNLTPNVGGEFVVNFGGQMDVGGRSTSAGVPVATAAGGMSLTTIAMIGGGVVLVLLVLKKGRK